MSEADSPNDQSGSPAPAAPVESSAALDAAAEVSNSDNSEGWQTVDFPGATSVDAIPHSLAEPVKHRLADDMPVSQGVIHYSSAEINQAAPFALSSEIPDDTTLQQWLQDENAELRDRLAQMELDLVQQQIEWQLESARRQTQSEAATVSTAASAGAIAPPSTFEPTNERLSQLLQELERSHQTVQRQQILVETLTAQLESSQERIAQLERDCALTQQRYNEQVQQVLQAEGACRDLRLRLHRQQQQTLQFKAALEKCLEMPTVYGQQVMPDVAIDDSAATPDALAALLKPKNQPVKPWSLPRQAAHEPEHDQTELPKPLFKLLGLSVQGNESTGLQENTLPAPADPSALLDSDDPEFVTQLMQLIFPATAEQQAYTTDAPQAEPIFDLSPFLVPGTIPADTTPSDEPSQDELVSTEFTGGATELPEVTEAAGQQEDAAPLNASAIVSVSTSEPSVDRATDPLWDNLAALIDPPNTVKGAKVALPAEPTHLDNVSDSDSASENTAPSIATWTWRDRLEKASKRPQSAAPEKALPERVVSAKVISAKVTQSPAKLLALSSVSQPAASASSHAEPRSTPFATIAPSPIVYPLRATKKLASLAAVDLPTFPKC